MNQAMCGLGKKFLWKFWDWVTGPPLFPLHSSPTPLPIPPRISMGDVINAHRGKGDSPSVGVQSYLGFDSYGSLALVLRWKCHCLCLLLCDFLMLQGLTADRGAFSFLFICSLESTFHTYPQAVDNSKFIPMLCTCLISLE